MPPAKSTPKTTPQKMSVWWPSEVQQVISALASSVVRSEVSLQSKISAT